MGLGNHDPISDVKFLEYEISMWLNGILNRNWEKLMRNYKALGGKPDQVLIDQMAGAGVSGYAHPARPGGDEEGPGDLECGMI